MGQTVKVLSIADAKTRLAKVGAKLVRKGLYQLPGGGVVTVQDLGGGQVKLIAAQGCDC